MPYFKYSILLLLILSACHSLKEKKFETAKWKYKTDMEYTYRDNMLADLTKNYQIKGISYTQLIDLLGEPENWGNTNNTLYYEIKTDYGTDIDSVFSKTLEITLHPDSTVEDFRVIEWKR